MKRGEFQCKWEMAVVGCDIMCRIRYVIAFVPTQRNRFIHLFVCCGVTQIEKFGISILIRYYNNSLSSFRRIKKIPRHSTMTMSTYRPVPISMTMKIRTKLVCPVSALARTYS